MTFTIHASKDGHLVQTWRLQPQAAVAKARGWTETGWDARITDHGGNSYLPWMFDELLQGESVRAARRLPQLAAGFD